MTLISRGDYQDHPAILVHLIASVGGLSIKTENMKSPRKRFNAKDSVRPAKETDLYI